MKILILALALIFSAMPAMATDHRHRCVLKNTELCGEWEGWDNGLRTVFIYGNYMRWRGGDHNECKVIREERYEDTLYALLQCYGIFILPHEIDHSRGFIFLKSDPTDHGRRTLDFGFMDDFHCSSSNTDFFATEPVDKTKLCPLNTLKSDRMGIVSYGWSKERH